MHQQLSLIFLLEFCFFRYSTTTKYTSSSIRSVLFYLKKAKFQRFAALIIKKKPLNQKLRNADMIIGI